MKNIFEYKAYVPYLKAFFKQAGPRGGLKSNFSKAVSCQTTYLSRVLNGQANLSFEQGLDACEFMNLIGMEKEYFLLLIQKERAGTVKLKNHILGKIDELQQKRMDISKRIDIKSKLNPLDETTYYGNWYYTAIHMLATVPGYAEPSKLSQHLRVSIEIVEEVLGFLESRGFIIKKDHRYILGSSNTYLERGSKVITRHHNNWRVRGLQAVEINDAKNLHYTTIMSLSRADIKKLKNRIIETIKLNLKEIEPSPEEVVYCNTIDFFEV